MSHFKKLFESTKTIAVVGLSNNPERASYRVSAYMLSQGYQIIPVNPFADEILGQKVFAQLSEIPFKIDLVNVFRTAQDCPAITQENSLAYALETYLLPLNQLLVQQPFLLGGYFQLVDLAIFPFIRQFAMVDLERFKQLPLPYLQKWLNFFLQSELFEQVMTKYPLWIDPKLTLTNS